MTVEPAPITEKGTSYYCPSKTLASEVRRHHPDLWKFKDTAQWYWKEIVFGLNPDDEDKKRFSLQESIALISDLMSKGFSRKQMASFLGTHISSIDCYAIGRARAPMKLKEIEEAANQLV